MHARRLTVQLLPGDRHPLPLEQEAGRFRQDGLGRLGLLPRETELLGAVRAIEEAADVAWELCLGPDAVQTGSLTWQPNFADTRSPAPSS